MLAAGVAGITHLGQEGGLRIHAIPYARLADHVVERRRAFDVIDLDHRGGLTCGQQRGAIIHELDGVEVDPVPTVRGGRIGFVDAGMIGGLLVIGEQVAEIHQQAHLAGVGVHLDDLILHGMVRMFQIGGQRDDIAVGIQRVIMVQDVLVAQIDDLDQLA